MLYERLFCSVIQHDEIVGVNFKVLELRLRKQINKMSRECFLASHANSNAASGIYYGKISGFMGRFEHDISIYKF